MPIVHKNGDLFTSKAKYLCHQVNCMGKMGSGIARTVREKFPNAYHDYMTLCLFGGKTTKQLLGGIQFCECGQKIIVNMFGQETYGTFGQHTDYDAFRKCLKHIHNNVPAGSTIAFPHGIGCGLGGGKWAVILPMIEEELAADYEVEVWKYGV